MVVSTQRGFVLSGIWNKMGIYRKNMSAMPNVSGKADKNEAIMQKFGHRKKKISVYAQTRKKRGKETEKLGSRERKNLYMPNFAENIFLKQITS